MRTLSLTLLWRFIKEYAWPYRWWFIGGGIFLYATNWMAVQIPLEVQRAVDFLQSPDLHSFDLYHTAWLILGIGAAMVVVRTLSRLLFFTPGRYIEADLRNAIFAHLAKLQPDYYDCHKSGEIVSKLTNDINAVRGLAGFASLQSVNVVMGIGLAVYRMMRINPTVTLYCLLPIIGLFILMQGGLRRIFGLVKVSQIQLAALSDHALSSYNGVAVMRAFNAEEIFKAQFQEKNAACVQSNVKIGELRAVLIPLLSLMGGLGLFMLLYFGGHFVALGTLTVGNIAALVGLIAVMLPALMSFGWLLSVVERGVAALDRLYDILDAPPSLPELGGGQIPLNPPLPFDSAQGPEIRALSGVEGLKGRGNSLLSIKNLSFRYSAASPLVLKNISCSFYPGEIVGIFGQTGAGKSTLFSVLLRLYTPPPGAVFLEGRDVREFPIDEYRRHFASVPQRPFLFSQSIAQNIRMGSARELSEEELWSLVQESELAADIATFPDKLDTVVGPRGVMLSGGQRQRLALARALASDAPILLLDDVLSAVDHVTEERLIRRLYARLENKHGLSLIISHRLSVLRRAHRILVLDRGELVAKGTHDQLRAQSEIYARIWERQRLEEEGV